MNIIKTKEFNISEAKIRQVTRSFYYKQIRIIIITFAIITVISVIIAILSPQGTNVWVAVGFVVLLGYFLAVPFIINPSKTQPKFKFQNSICEITDNYINMTYEDGSLTKVHFNSFIKVTRESEWYFLYLTKVMVEFLPIRAFNSEDDINEFEAALSNKKLMK